MRPSYSTIVTRMNESSGSVVVVPAAVLFQPRICRVEMIEWEEGPDKGTDQKSSTPCWKRRRGGWLNSPLLLSKRNPGVSKELAEGEGEEDNWRLVDPFDLLMGKDKYELIGQVHWDKYGQGVGLSEKKEPLCERVRSKEEENKKAKECNTVSMETTERLKRKTWAPAGVLSFLPIPKPKPPKSDGVPVEAQSDLNQGIIVGEDFKDSFYLLGNLLVIYFCNGFKS
ncbi:hypothetical protein PPACK8108_LOCUS14906 [Phakopsora pachyrhizi]|uniref:Uncharacterized protein n=1 Tax=Phakopsora pachyrhizi TaxID=170000 RepID=A0AAV0B9G9_PHAPC|nr:hypothetical protein PPACK8108_LOCUS14906 [Phakopsora pachyrhizi]